MRLPLSGLCGGAAQDRRHCGGVRASGVPPMYRIPGGSRPTTSVADVFSEAGRAPYYRHHRPNVAVRRCPESPISSTLITAIQKIRLARLCQRRNFRPIWSPTSPILGARLGFCPSWRWNARSVSRTADPGGMAGSAQALGHLEQARLPRSSRPRKQPGPTCRWSAPIWSAPSPRSDFFAGPAFGEDDRREWVRQFGDPHSHICEGGVQPDQRCEWARRSCADAYLGAMDGPLLCG